MGPVRDPQALERLREHNEAPGLAGSLGGVGGGKAPSPQHLHGVGGPAAYY